MDYDKKVTQALVDFWPPVLFPFLLLPETVSGRIGDLAPDFANDFGTSLILLAFGGSVLWWLVAPWIGWLTLLIPLLVLVIQGIPVLAPLLFLSHLYPEGLLQCS